MHRLANREIGDGSKWPNDVKLKRRLRYLIVLNIGIIGALILPIQWGILGCNGRAHTGRFYTISQQSAVGIAELRTGRRRAAIGSTTLDPTVARAVDLETACAEARLYRAAATSGKQVGTLASHQSPWPGRTGVMGNKILNHVAQQRVPYRTQDHSELNFTALMWTSVTKTQPRNTTSDGSISLRLE